MLFDLFGLTQHVFFYGPSEPKTIGGARPTPAARRPGRAFHPSHLTTQVRDLAGRHAVGALEMGLRDLKRKTQPKVPSLSIYRKD